jgi:hypothetical protein
MADLDNDGLPELISSGMNYFRIHRNTGGTSFDDYVDFPSFKFNAHVFSLDVGDFDKDGFLDIVHGGLNAYGPNTPPILSNPSPGITQITGSFIESHSGGILFTGDYDGDGDLDLLSPYQNGILIRRGDSWYPDKWFPSYGSWYAHWSNFDNDSPLEVIQSFGGSNYFLGNDLLDQGDPVLTKIRSIAIPTFIVDARFADFDADGDLDMLSTQSTGNGLGAVLYRNVNGNFENTGIAFPACQSIEFGDVNNDGRVDIILGSATTATWQVFETAVFLFENNNSYVRLDAGISAQDYQRASVGDFDNDGDLDLGTHGGMFRNDVATVNGVPQPPTFTGQNVNGSTVELFWQPGSDDTTPAAGLTYNLSVRAADGTVIVPAHALPDGRRQIFKPGNAWNALSFDLTCLKPGTYFWKIQAIDAAFSGSAFTSEQSFTISKPASVAPSNLTATAQSDESVYLTWTDQSTTEDGFVIFRKEEGYPFGFSPIDTVMSTQTNYLDTLYLNPETTYHYRVAASNCAFPSEIYSEVSAVTFPPAFVNSGWLNTGAAEGRFALLGDSDNDGDLDLVLTRNNSVETILYRFNGTAFVHSGMQFPFTASGGAWVDFNGDGLMDLMLTGASVKLYQNTNGTVFSEVSLGGFPGTDISWQGGLSFGDYDQDGDEDLLVQATSGIYIYNNDGTGKFTRNTAINLPGHVKSTQAWGDYDRDGDLDILASREISCSENILVIFENKPDHTFVAVTFPGLSGVNDDFQNRTGKMEWGDYDADGFPDILVAGQHACGNGSGINRVYRNNGNKTFTQTANLLQLIYDVNVQWGDYDNDGDLDIFSYGDAFTANMPYTRLYRNDNGTFKVAPIDYLIKSRQYGSALPGDIDHDGDLDYVILGRENFQGENNITVYKSNYANAWGRVNNRPDVPAGPFESAVDNFAATLTWTKATDDLTPQNGLTYNVEITRGDNSDLLSAYVSADGTRSVVEFGNAGSSPSLKLRNLNPGIYSWRVQSIDNAFAGSEFSAQQTFEIEMVTGLEETQTAGVRVFPNPVEDVIHVQFPGNESGWAMELTNTVGQTAWLASLSTSSDPLSVSMLPSGLYLARVYRQGQLVATKKLIKK